MAMIHDGDPFLKTLGDWFEGVGLGDYAVQAFIRSGDIKRAITSCINLNNVRLYFKIY